jgi:hypothetical protein
MRLLRAYEEIFPQFHVWIWFRYALGTLIHNMARATVPVHILRRAGGLRGILVAALYAYYDLWHTSFELPKYEDGLCAPYMDDGGLVTTMVLTLVVLFAFNGAASSYIALAAQMCAVNYTSLALPLAYVALFVASTGGGWALAGSVVAAALGGVWEYRCFDMKLLTKSSGPTLAIMVGVAHLTVYCKGLLSTIFNWYVYLLCCCACCGMARRRRVALSRKKAPPGRGVETARLRRRRAPSAPSRRSSTQTVPWTLTRGRTALP